MGEGQHVMVAVAGGAQEGQDMAADGVRHPHPQDIAVEGRGARDIGREQQHMAEPARPPRVPRQRRAAGAQAAEIARAVHPPARRRARRCGLGDLQIDQIAVGIAKPEPVRQPLARRIEQRHPRRLQPRLGRCQARGIGPEADVMQPPFRPLAQQHLVLGPAGAAERQAIAARRGFQAEGLVEAPARLDIGHRQGEMLQIADHERLQERRIFPAAVGQGYPPSSWD